MIADCLGLILFGNDFFVINVFDAEKEKNLSRCTRHFLLHNALYYGW